LLLTKIYNYIPFKAKLFLGFFVIIASATYISFQNYKLMNQTSELVYITYDKTLMAGQFAQAAKFDYSQFDSKFKKALMAKNLEAFEKYTIQANQSLDILKEDLDVVRERSLSESKTEIFENLQSSLSASIDYQDKILKEKIKLLSKKFSLTKSRSLVLKWEEFNKKNKLFKNLNILFDDAAENGYIFRLESEEKNIKNLELTKKVSIANLVLSLFFALLLSYIIIKPLSRLDRTCKAVETGDYTIRSNITSKDEFGKLSSSFNHMLNTIEKKDKSMEVLLEALPYGVFYFNRDGSTSKERSAATDIIFPRYSEFKNISDFFNEFDKDSSSIMSLVLNAFENVLPFNSIAYLLPQTLHKINDDESIQTIKLTYKEAKNKKNKLERIIIIAQDITELEYAKEQSKKLTNKVLTLESASKDKQNFRLFVNEGTSLFKRLISNTSLYIKDFDKSFVPEIKRDLHSLKGMFSLYKFILLVDEIHEIETFLNQDERRDPLDFIKTAYEHFNDQTNLISSILNFDQASIVTEVNSEILNMPKMDGLQLLKKMRGSEKENIKNFKFLMLTTESEKDKIIEAIKYKVNGYIIKQNMEAKLIEEIERILSLDSL
jgi:HAMP domain-containing protein